MAKIQAHTRYMLEEDGKKVRVPGVTTILGVLAKNALIPWANRLGLDGIDVNKYVDAKAEIGTCAHYLIECHCKKVTPDLGDYSPNTVSQAENSYLKWLDWAKQNNLEVEESEVQLVSRRHRFGGTIDILGWVNGEYSLVDMKTSGSGIYPEMRHQVAAYNALVLERAGPTGKAPVNAFIVRVGRDDTEGFEVAKVAELDKHFELFLHCKFIYDLQKELK